MRLLVPFLVFVMAAAPLAHAQTTISVRADDGTTLTGSYYAAAAPGPVVLLIHQCNMDRRAWAPLATRLVAAGVHVVAPDLRGFGDNKIAGQSRAPSEKWAGDLDLWFDEMQKLPNVDGSRMAAGGASCGVVESTLLATRRRTIRALLEISGRTNLDGLEYLRSGGAPAIFGVGAEQDDPDGIRDLLAASRHPRSTMKIYPGAEHGAPLLAAHPEISPIIVRWLTEVLAQ